MGVTAIRKKLLAWYQSHHRDLPWRRTSDPYAIWISEIMLQQTRVVAVIPYYQRFLTRFPTVSALAAAREEDLLSYWSGLGYYSRARNLQKAAIQIVQNGRFPDTYDDLLELAGIGEYTAAAVSSIAFGLPHAVIDGNVKRVVMRLASNADVDVRREVDQLLDRRDPGTWNQAVMELGATVCLPKAPLCLTCPLARECGARRHGTTAELPPKREKAAVIHKLRTLLIVPRRGQILLVPSPRVRGFWDLPEPFADARLGERLGSFRHAITNSQYMFEVYRASMSRAPAGSRWCRSAELNTIALSTTAKKGLQCWNTLEERSFQYE